MRTVDTTCYPRRVSPVDKFYGDVTPANTHHPLRAEG